MEERRAQLSLILLIMFLAVILGVFAFMAYVAVQRRPSPLDNQIQVVDQTITLFINPDLRMQIVGDPVLPEPAVEAPAELVPEAEPVVIEVTAVPAEQPTAAAQGGMPSEMYIFLDHPVQANDTLYSLANQYNTTIPLLARFGTSTLIPGENVRITRANPQYCPTSGWYIAREGDSPGGIAAMYGTTLDVLNQLNNWNGVYAVYETNVICVP